MSRLVLSLKVKPRSRVSELIAQPDGTFVAHVKAEPVDGRANAELIALVAHHFGVRAAQVSIKSGGSSKTKLLVVETG